MKQASLLGKAKQTGDTARLQFNVLNSSITQAPKSNLKFVIQQNTACFYIPAAKKNTTFFLTAFFLLQKQMAFC
jgi:hypothetical protein